MRSALAIVAAALVVAVTLGIAAEHDRPAAATDPGVPGDVPATALELPVPPLEDDGGLGPAEEDGAEAVAPPARVPAPGNAGFIRQSWAYGPFGERNEMDVYAPAATAGRTGLLLPTVVLIHGGSWVHGDKSAFTDVAKQFVDEGYVAVAVNYRLAGAAAWPAQRTDVLRAVLAVRREAGRFNADPRRIVLVGSSAGAHLAAIAGTYGEGLDLVRGFVALSGPLDVAAVARAVDGGSDRALAARVRRELLRCPPTQCPARYADATPAARLSWGDAPSLLFAARAEWVDPQNSVAFAAAAEAVGVRSQVVLLDGDRHAAQYWSAVWPVVRDWVAARMAAPVSE